MFTIQWPTEASQHPHAYKCICGAMWYV